MAAIAATATLAITETVTPGMTHIPTRRIRAGTGTRITAIPIITDALTTTTDTPVALITTMGVVITTPNAITTTSHAIITARKDVTKQSDAPVYRPANRATRALSGRAVHGLLLLMGH